jgi:DNA mismatch repair protein MutL
MVGRHPIAVLNVQVDPADVDANVHPTKAEVKFRQERTVFVALQKAVRSALAAHSPVPSFGTRGAEGWQLPGAPESAGTGSATLAPDAGMAGRSFVNGSPLPPPTRMGGGESGTQADLFGGYLAPALAWTQNGVSVAPGDVTPQEPPLTGDFDPDLAPAMEGPGSRTGPDPLGPLPTAPGVGTLPPLRVIGQVSNTYIITEGPDGMFLIDQHAAHERVLYEKFDREVRAGRGVAVQPLLHPLTVDLTPGQWGELQGLLPLLEQVGFQLEAVATPHHELLVRAVPALYAERASLGGLLEILDELLIGSPPDRWRDQLVITLACHSAVRAGKSLGLEEMRALVGQLETCHFPRLCAHGRPTMLHLSALQLEREFGRRG